MTLRALASRLGLSITTVSRALDGYDDVAVATRERVRQAADEIGYRPNPLARRLRKGSAEAVALVMPTEPGRFFEPAFGELLALLGVHLAEAKLDLMLLAVRPGMEETAVYRRLVEGRRVDACILFRTRRSDERVAYLAAAGLPFVCFGRTSTRTPYAYVDGAAEEGFADLTRRLIGLGRRRFAHLQGPESLTFSGMCARGFSRALNEAGLSPVGISEAEATEEGGYRAATDLLAGPTRPDAIVAATDRMALGAYRAIGEAGARIGVDIAVTGHDNIAATGFTQPPLTTMEVPIAEAAQRLVEWLSALMGGARPEDLQIVLPLNQLPRASSGEESRPVQDG
jgi:LacI family transcriptional regulator